MVELLPGLTARCEAARPVHDRAVARPTPVRCDLLGPLVRRVHRVGPADRIVVVGVRRAEQVDLRRHELGRLQVRGAVQQHHLVEGAVDPALGRGAVVADHVEHQGVLQHTKVLKGVDQPPDLEVRVLQEAGVHLHLTREDRLQLSRHVVPRGNLLVAGSQLAVRRHDAELLLAGQDLLTQSIPPVIEATLVLRRPLSGHVVRRVGRTGGVVDEERLVRHERLLLAHPPDRPVGHVLAEVIPLLRRPLRLDRARALVDRGVVLVGLPADEPVEVLEPSTTGRPRIERAHRAGLPHRHLMALAELRRRVAIQPQRLRQRSARVRAQRVVARRRGRELGHHAHPHRVVVATREQRRARRRAQRGGVETVVAQAPARQAFGRRRVARPAERARRGETDVVKQDDQHVRRPHRRPKRHNRRERRIPRIERQLTGPLPIRNRQDRTVDVRAHRDTLLKSACLVRLYALTGLLTGPTNTASTPSCPAPKAPGSRRSGALQLGCHVGWGACGTGSWPRVCVTLAW